MRRTLPGVFVVFAIALLWFSHYPATAQVSGTLDTTLLPFDRPPRATLALGRKVLAHWHALPFRYYSGVDYPPDGWADWLKPTGFGNQYINWGGYVRNRPLLLSPPAAQNYSDYVQDMLLDVTLAAEIGIDAFMMNFWYYPGSNVDEWRWDAQMIAMFDAADSYSSQNTPGFSIAPNIDAAVIKQLDPACANPVPACTSLTPESFADAVALLKLRPSFMKVGATYVVGVFAMERLPLQWYQAFVNRLATVHGMSVYLLGHFLDPTTRAAYTSVMQGYSRWDIVPYPWIGSEIAERIWATSQTPPLSFGSSVGQSFDVPSFLTTGESGGFQTLVGMWTRAIAEADWVQIITWNDHGEGTNLRPNTASQYAYYDLTAYYVAWFKTGAPPTITRDVLYYSHRMLRSTASYDPNKQFNSADPPQEGPIGSQNEIPFDDKVFLFGFLTNGGTLQIKSGGTWYSQVFGAGAHMMSAPFAENDQPQFKLTVSGVDTIDFLSAFHTRSGTGIIWQDFLYRAGSSSRPAVTAVQDDLPQDRTSP